MNPWHVALALGAVITLILGMVGRSLWVDIRSGTPSRAEGGVSSRELASMLVTSGWLFLTKGKAAAATYGEEVGEHWRRRHEQGGGQPLPKPKGKERAFVADIGDWPKVWKISDGPPAVYELKARYSSPQGLKLARDLAAAGGVAVAVWLGRAITPAGATGAPFVVGVSTGLILGLATFVVLRVVLWLANPLIGPSLHMKFTGDAIEWKGYRYNWWGKSMKEKIFPNEARGEVRVIAHRQAPAEMRKAQERARANKKERRMYYQQASEVIIDAGSQGTTQLKVAEIADDEQCDKGGKIAGAIVLATRAAQGMGGPGTAEPGPKKKGLFG